MSKASKTRLQDVVKMTDPDQIEALEECLRANVPEFLALHAQHPIKRHDRGYVSLGEAFWLWQLVRDLAPQTAIESGTMDGWSAWWLWKALPKGGDLLTFDPTVENPAASRLLVGGAWGDRWKHRKLDFGQWKNEPACGLNNAVAFFDDHQNQSLRLEQAMGVGIKHVVLHDVDPRLPPALPRGCAVMQFPRVREPEVFRRREHSENCWLTYCRLLP